MLPAYIYWLALVILFGIAEAATLGLTSIWFALGALGAMVVAIFDGALLLQIAVFVVISGVAVWLTRGWGRVRAGKHPGASVPSRRGCPHVPHMPTSGEGKECIGAETKRGGVWVRFTCSAEGALNFEQPPRCLEGHLVYLLQVLPFGT